MTASAKIGTIHHANLQEFWTDERCFITELMNTPEVPEFSLARCRVERDIKTQLHRLNVAEWYIVSQGQGLMELGDQAAFEIGPGDSVQIPANTPQCVTNTGPDDLIFECACMPRFIPACYESLES